MLVDLSTPETFVLESAEFLNKFGPQNVFNPAASSTFKNKTTYFVNAYIDMFPKTMSMVHGYLGEDRISGLGKEFQTTFGVVQRYDNSEPNLSFLNQTFAGRIGLSNTKDPKTSVRDTILRDSHLPVVCLEATANKTHNSTTVRIGDYIYNKTSFKTKVPAIKPEFPFEGLWIAPVDGVSIDGVNFNDSYGAILATTVDVIGLPGGPYEHLLKKLKPKYDQDLREWVVDCALNIDIKLAIGKSEIVIEFGAYTDKLTETKCRLKLDVSQWNRLLLGAPFFTNNGICLNYESDEIHFYEVPHTNSGMKIASSSFLITCLLTFALFLPK
ncbi:unnamed protein product [Bursaphelenchus xylophilus]|uniref:(pine wood nematode) hypothetical protein n=1 Tax=Bursaphelenchus xylophilus TaxID=6326 RepID=A0A7I8WZK8_BURXY|nr:unnamed protein product [Bursaphelenchus xylophilus]CAG9102376.1 unnamed protein product [Bursaphelenchus xylophilus]